MGLIFQLFLCFEIKKRGCFHSKGLTKLGSFTKWGFWATALALTELTPMLLLRNHWSTRLCWRPMWKWGRPKRFCSLQMASSLESAPFWGLSVWGIINQSSPFEGKTSYHPPTCYYPSPYTAFLLLFGFSAWISPQRCLEQRGAISLRSSGCSFPPSGQGGGLKIPTKCSRICFCAIKRLQSKQISFLLGTCDAHYILPLATSWAAACNGGLRYKKMMDFIRSGARRGEDCPP